MIAIFGASVTIQKNGYAFILRSKFNEDVQIFGHGAMHLYNAGICFIDEVLSQKPSYCFVDWFSTAYVDMDEKVIEYIDTIIHKFSKASCKLVFLFFPSGDYSERIIFHQFCKRHLKKRKVYYIDVNKKIDSLTGVLRDNVHTTDFGSEKYSDIIYNEFIGQKDAITIPGNTLPTRFLEIKKLGVERIFKQSVELAGDCEVIGFLLTIGPHSGIVKVTVGNRSETLNTWDKWCHYNRKSFRLPCSVKGKLKIDILQESFDTSNCRRKYNFTNQKKKLVIHNIHYIGKYLKLNNMTSGVKIVEISFARKILRKLSRKLWKR